METSEGGDQITFREARVISLSTLEKKLIAETFLGQLTSSACAVGFVFSIAFAVLAFLTLALPSSLPPLSGSLQNCLFFFILAGVSFGLSCAMFYVWRPIIFVISLIVCIAALAIFARLLDGIGSVLNRSLVTDTDPTYEIVVNSSFFILALWFLWSVLSDGFRLSMTPAAARELISASRRSPGLIQALTLALGVNPVCRWLSARRRLIASTLFVLGSSAAGLAVLVAAVGLVRIALRGPTELFADLFTIFAGGGVLVGLAGLFRTVARRSARLSAEKLAEGDKRASILFLRSFKDDQVRLGRPKRGVIRALIGAELPTPTLLDHVLLEEFTSLGPVVAIGIPGARPPFGAARAYAEEGEWRNVIAKYAAQAQAIVIAVDNTAGVEWEVSHIVGSGHLQKTLFLLPQRIAVRSEQAAQHIRRALLDTRAKLDVGLTQACIGWFQTPDGETVLLVSRRPSALSYVCAVRLFCQRDRAKLLSRAA